MSIYQSYLGKGWLRFQVGPDADAWTVDFPDAIVKTKTKPEYTEFETVNHRLIHQSLGYRVTLTITLFNLLPGDAPKVVQLAQMIDQNPYIKAYPRYNELSANSLHYDGLLLNSAFDPEELSDACFCGQSIELEFICRDLIQTLPTTLSDVELTYWVTNTDIITYNGTDSIVFSEEA